MQMRNIQRSIRIIFCMQLSRDLFPHASKIRLRFTSWMLVWGGMLVMCCLVFEAGMTEGRMACKQMTSFQGHGAFARREMFCIHFLEAAASVAQLLDFCGCPCRVLSAPISKVKLAGMQLGDYTKSIRKKEPIISLHGLKPSRICQNAKHFEKNAQVEIQFKLIK